MTPGITIRKQINFTRGQRREKRLRIGPKKPEAPGRIPRISRLLALAIEIDRLIHDGIVKDYAEAARLSHVTRSRITQVMGLLALAPDIIEDILFLPRVEHGDDPTTEREVRPIAAVLDWKEQRGMWLELKAQRGLLLPHRG